MKVAITTPTTWPRVRRGSERFLNELAFFLAERGHEVTVIACKPGRKETRVERGYTTVCHRRIYHPALARWGVHEFHAFIFNLLPALIRRRYDVVVCSTFIDAIAGQLARSFTHVPCVFWVNGVPPRVAYQRAITAGGRIFGRAIRGSDEVIVLSRYMQRDFDGRFGRGGVEIPVPVDTLQFPLVHDRDHDRPVILCAAALDDERKGGETLMRAFNVVKESSAKAVLRVAAGVSPQNRARLSDLVSPKWRADVEFAGTVPLDKLPGEFGRASVSVLPSLWEAFGLVIVESMSTGTPVVGTRDGAIPELIHDGVGRLFDPEPTRGAATANVEGLASALLEALELSRNPETAIRCRHQAEQYSWDKVGPAFEALLAELAGGAGAP
jgi:phosphatidylinositol alpha-mannosyltransferase